MPNDRGFYVLPSFYAALRFLPVKDRGELWSAMMDYAFAGVIPDLPSRLAPYWMLIKPSIDASAMRKQRRSNVQPMERQRTPVDVTTDEYRPSVGVPVSDQCTTIVTTTDEQWSDDVQPMDDQCLDNGRFSRAH